MTATVRSIQILKAVARDYEAAGYPVDFLDGWETHGRPYAVLNPRGGVAHHTATGPNWNPSHVDFLLRDGRRDLPGPLSQVGLDRDATLVVVAAGTANHAGSGGWRGLKGNGSVFGIEAYNSGLGEPWPQVQLDGYILLAALFCKHSGFGPEMWSMHREWSVDGKIDPTGIDGPWFRAQVEAKLHSLNTPTPEVTEVSPYAFRYVSGNLDWLFDPQFQIHAAIGSDPQLKFLDALGVKEKGRVDITVHDLLSGISSNWKR